MRTNNSRGSAILAGRAQSQSDRDAKATAHEANTIASRLRQGLEPLCQHDHTLGLERKDRTTDRNALQQAGIAACKARQIAAYVAQEKAE
jgi:hypothetical protein